MRWLRSWPSVVPKGRAHVVDELERLLVRDYDYSPLGGVDDDVLLLEWDIACGQEDLERFEARAAGEPRRVRVAPYRLYPASTSLPAPVWAHRIADPTVPERDRFVGKNESPCDLFGFGMVYLPRALVRAFLEAPAPARGRDVRLPAEAPYQDCRFTDQTFSAWHWRHQALQRRGMVPVDWDVRPVHLRS